MRRITAILLSIAFVISTLVVAAVPVSAETATGTVASDYAPEGTGIASLADATDPAGKYYLTGDITVNETLSVEFTGTLDGNGHTVTVSAPIFEILSGTVKNMTVAGAIDRSAVEKVHTGAIANTTGEGSTVVLENVKNTATVKGCLADWESSYAGSDTYAFRAGTGAFIGIAFGSLDISKCENTAEVAGYAVGGFVGYVESKVTTDAQVSVKDSKNSGKISSTGTVKLKNNGAVGGFIGITNNTKNLTFENLVNDGEIYGENSASASKSMPAGGVVGYCYTGIKKSDDGLCKMKNVVNNAKVTGTNQVGGVAGWVRLNLEADKAVNNGDVESTENYAGGVFGRVGSDGIGSTDGAWSCAVLKNCENHGTVKSASGQTGGVVGYSNAPADFYNCVNTADISAVKGKASGILGAGGTGCKAKFYSCINTGNMESADDNAGGISASVNGTKIADFAASKGGYIIDARYCVNTGNIKANAATGGIFGRVGADGNFGFEMINYCINTGSVEHVGASASSLANGAAGGILGYAYGSAKKEYPVVKNCVSMGTVTAGSEDNGVACGVIGYFSSANAEITGNKVSAALNAASGLKYVLAWDNNAGGIKAGDGNSAPEGNTYPVVRKGSKTDGSDDDRFTLGVFDPATAVSGELVFSLNEAVKADTDLGVTEDVFFQKLGETFVPTVVPEVRYESDGTPVVVNAVVKGADGAFSNPTVVAPGPGPDGPDTPATGDSTAVMIVVLALSAVAVLGLALIPKKKYN